MKTVGRILIAVLAAMFAWMTYEIVRAPEMPDWHGLDDDIDEIFDDELD